RLKAHIKLLYPLSGKEVRFEFCKREDMKLKLLTALLLLNLQTVLSDTEESTEGLNKEAEETTEHSNEEVAINEEEEICFLPKDIGPCRMHDKRFYFNSRTKTCTQFGYGGCWGNRNNFENLESCVHSCRKLMNEAPKERELPEICKQVPELGSRRCKASFARWTYDSENEKCKPYIYGGCGGTDNLFKSKKQCMKTCGLHSKLRGAQSGSSFCDDPIAEGPCFGTYTRYGFNKTTNACQEFTYGGCEGNENNFPDIHECERTCKTKVNIRRMQSTEVDMCDSVKCNWRLYQHYAQRGCRPVYLKKECCPSYYKCPNSSVFQNKCYYNGNFYEIGEQIPEKSEDYPCQQGCFCQDDSQSPNNTTITCASVECPEQLGWLEPGKESCKRIYKPNDCCATDFVSCKTEEADDETNESTDNTVEAPICNYNNKSYIEGERFYPREPDAPCQMCTCTPEFNGIFGPGCRTILCNIRLPSPGCVPVYDEKVCCPYKYKCPSEYALDGIKKVERFNETESAEDTKENPGDSASALSGEEGEEIPNESETADQATYKRNGPFIQVGVPGKMPVMTLPIAIDKTLESKTDYSATYNRTGPFIEIGLPGKMPVRTLPIAIDKVFESRANYSATYNRSGPFIQVGIPGKIPVATLPIAVSPFCMFGDVRFELGEQLLTSEECLKCTCATPPELTCVNMRYNCPPPPKQPVEN
ncbi:hypothetical protein QYM36_015008, partial [Artemia franciscana]